MSATRTEVPHTAAAVRLTGLEISDCVQELNGLGCVGSWETGRGTWVFRCSRQRHSWLPRIGPVPNEGAPLEQNALRPVLTLILSVGFPTIIFQSNKPDKAP